MIRLTRSNAFLLKKNGKAIAVGVILGIGVLAGWRYWSNRQFNSARGMSQSYEAIVSAIRANRQQTLADIEQFTVDNKNIYGALAALEVAQLYVDKDELDKAMVQLQRGISSVDDDNLKSLISLRIARIQVQQKKADDALKTLNTINGGFATIVADLRGDALLSKGDKQGARSAWEAAVRGSTSTALKEVLQMKINELSV